MSLVATTRRYSFRSVHSLDTGVHREKLHGHEYFLEVGFTDQDHVVVDNVVAEKILIHLHAKDISETHRPATGENLVDWIHGQLLDSPIGASLIGVALQETRKNRFISALSMEYFL